MLDSHIQLIEQAIVLLIDCNSTISSQTYFYGKNVYIGLSPVQLSPDRIYFVE